MVDYLNFESLLTDNEQILMESVRRWVADRILPDIGGYFQRGEFPSHIVKEMGELGVLGIDLPDPVVGKPVVKLLRWDAMSRVYASEEPLAASDTNFAEQLFAMSRKLHHLPSS